MELTNDHVVETLELSKTPTMSVVGKVRSCLVSTPSLLPEGCEVVAFDASKELSFRTQFQNLKVFNEIWNLILCFSLS